MSFMKKSITRYKLYGQKLRRELIKRECRSKNVLDVGCVGDDKPSLDARLHKDIAEVADRCIGIDINPKGVKELRKQGYDVRLADAEDFNFNEKFEVAVLGELIEHLSNPGMALDNIRNHLKPQGKMILTTPNPHSPSIFKEYELQDVGNPAHVAYYSPTLFRRLARRHGFEERKIVWIQRELKEPRTVKGKAFVMLGRFLLPNWLAAGGWLGIYGVKERKSFSKPR